MQRHVLPAYPARRQRLEQGRREMQPGGRGRHGPFYARVHRLVVRDVARIGLALAGDIGRQRCLAFGRDDGIQGGAVQCEPQLDLAGLAACGNLSVDC